MKASIPPWDRAGKNTFTLGTLIDAVTGDLTPVPRTAYEIAQATKTSTRHLANINDNLGRVKDSHGNWKKAVDDTSQMMAAMGLKTGLLDDATWASKQGMDGLSKSIRDTIKAGTWTDFAQLALAVAAAKIAMDRLTAHVNTSVGSLDGVLGAGFGQVRKKGGPVTQATGGMIAEHVVGWGLSTGRSYELGEQGPEMVTPLRGGQNQSSGSGGNIYISNVNVSGVQDIQSLMNQIRKAALDQARGQGVRSFMGSYA